MNRTLRRFGELFLEHWWLKPLAFLLAGTAAWACFTLAKPPYRRWRGARAAEQARGFLRDNDLPRTDLALQVALLSDPSPPVYRLLAEYLEACGSNQAVEARRIACQLSPKDAALKLEFARTALHFSDLEAAREALASISPADQLGFEFRRIEATYSLLAGEWARAARLLGGLKADSPSDLGLRLLDDSLRLHEANLQQAEAARLDLRALAREPVQRLPALRVLLADAMARRHPMDAGEAGRAVAAAKGATFSDLLSAASAEELAFPSTGADGPLLATIQALASSSPSMAASYGRWLFLQKGAETAAAWLDRQSRALAQNPALVALQAEVSAARGDWPALRRQLEQGAWGPVLPRALDFAFAAQLVRQQGDRELAADTWSEALREGTGSQSCLRSLARLADIWKWPDGMQSGLFATVKGFPGDEVAAQRLIGLLRARRDSRALLELLTLRRDTLPPSDRRSADWALLSLLVSPPTRPDLATRTLDELYAKSPADPFLATDHAFAQWRLGQVRAACRTIDGLGPEERLYPLRAPYLAIIYASAGRTPDARAALRRGPPAAELLPEEADLLSQAAQIALR